MPELPRGLLRAGGMVASDDIANSQTDPRPISEIRDAKAGDRRTTAAMRSRARVRGVIRSRDDRLLRFLERARKQITNAARSMIAFIRVHQAIPVTPAMEAGVADDVEHRKIVD